MSLSTVLASITWPNITATITGGALSPMTSTSDRQRITDAITDLYNGSPTAATELEAAATRGDLNFLQSTGGNVQAQNGSGLKLIGWDFNEIDKLHYFNTKGEIVKEKFELTIIHEIMHTGGAVDPLPVGVSFTETNINSNLDFNSIITQQNEVAAELGYYDNMQAGYYSTMLLNDTMWGKFDHSVSYSNHASIKYALWDQDNYDVANNYDLSTRTEVSNDILFGFGGDDTINGGGGDDFIFGGADNDTLIGGKGDDVLWGGDINVETGGGTDTADYDDASASDPKPIKVTFDGRGPVVKLTVADGLGGTDTLHSIEKIRGTSKTDTLKILGNIASGTTLTLDANHGQNGAQDIINGSNIQLSAADGFNVVITKASGRPDGATSVGSITDITGSPLGGGTINLLNFDTDVVGTAGNDTVTDDTDGDKKITGGYGDDVISIAGSSGNSILLGGAGDDTLTGGDGNDVLIGGYSNDTLNGGDGDDMIIGATGDFDGGAGNDYIKPTAIEGIPLGGQITGGAGDDVIDLRDGGAHYSGAYGNYFYTNGSILSFGANDGHDTVLTASGGSVWTSLSDDNIVNDHGADGIVIQLDGLYASDIEFIWDITNTQYAQYSSGYWGNGDLAIVVKSTGASIFIEDVNGSVNLSGSSPLIYQLGVNISDGSGNLIYLPSVSAQISDLSSYRGGEADYFDAAALSSSASTGTSGDDTMAGGRGDDTMSGGDGDDSFFGSPGNDSIDGGNGSDSVRLLGARSDYTITATGSGMVVQGNGVEVGTLTLTSIENVFFETDDTTYTSQDLFGYYGTAGNDVLFGNELGTSFYALAGDDQITPGTGNDTIDGGDGEDEVILEASSTDSFISRELDGSISVYDPASGSYDVLWNVEEVSFLGDSVTIDVDSLPALGTSGNDVLVGTARGENLYGQDGDDQLFGLGGNDHLNGGAGDDVLDGGSGNNGLDGGDGDDTLVGGAGEDSMYGDEGSDTYTVGDQYGQFQNVTIGDYGSSSDQDALILGDATYGFSVNGDAVIITNTATMNTISLENQLSGYGVESIQIGTSTVLDRNDIISQIPVNAIVGTSSDDTLTGTGIRDDVTGNAGNDYIQESGGDDVYRWNIGDGDDYIAGGDSNDGYNTVILGSGIATSDVTVTFTDFFQQSVLLSFAQGGSITLENINGTDQNVDVVQFDDNTSWDRYTLIGMAEDNSEGGGGGGPIGLMAMPTDGGGTQSFSDGASASTALFSRIPLANTDKLSGESNRARSRISAYDKLSGYDEVVARKNWWIAAEDFEPPASDLSQNEIAKESPEIGRSAGLLAQAIATFDPSVSGELDNFDRESDRKDMLLFHQRGTLGSQPNMMMAA